MVALLEKAVLVVVAAALGTIAGVCFTVQYTRNCVRQGDREVMFQRVRTHELVLSRADPADPLSFQVMSVLSAEDGVPHYTSADDWLQRILGPEIAAKIEAAGIISPSRPIREQPE